MKRSLKKIAGLGGREKKSLVLGGRERKSLVLGGRERKSLVLGDRERKSLVWGEAIVESVSPHFSPFRSLHVGSKNESRLKFMSVGLKGFGCTLR